MSRFSFLQPARCRVLLHQSQSASWVGWLCPGCCKVPSHWEKWEVPKGQCPTYYEGKCLIRLMWILHKPSVHTGWGGSNVGQHGFTSPIPNLSSLAVLRAIFWKASEAAVSRTGWALLTAGAGHLFTPLYQSLEAQPCDMKKTLLEPNSHTQEWEQCWLS